MSGRAGSDEQRLVAGLRRLYAAPEWALFSSVRSAIGSVEVLRIADAIAAHMWPTQVDAWKLHGFECKGTRADWQRERAHPEKSGPIKLFCSAWYVVVPAPWKHVVLSTSELPDRWGLIEIGTGKPNVVVTAAEREAEPPTPGFLRALLRVAAAEADEARDVAELDAPSMLITRPALSRSHVGLACGHVAARPLVKVMPPRLPCIGCAEGRPTDRALIEAAIDDASGDELLGIMDRLEGRLAQLAPEQSRVRAANG